MKDKICKKKVLFLSPLPPPYYGSAISSLMCLNILRTSEQFSVDNVKLNYSGTIEGVGKFSLSKFFDCFIVLYKLVISLLFNKYDLIYLVPATSGFALYRDYFYKSIISFFHKGKLILHLRSRFLDRDLRNFSTRLVIRKLLRTDLVIILGPELLDNAQQFTSEVINYITLPNAIPISLSQSEFEDYFKQKKDRISGKINLLFISNMNVEKGWFKLLEALRLLKCQDVEFSCNFIGGWPSDKEKSLFYNFVESNSLNKEINHLGALFNEEKIAYLKSADVLVFPTEYRLETFGRVIIEAMEYGVPVIASNIATIPSIILNNETGYILSEVTAEEILYGILKIKNSNLISEMSLKSRERFLNIFTEDIYREKFLTILNEL